MPVFVGTAENSKEAPLLLCDTGTYYIRDFHSWPEEQRGKTVELEADVFLSKDAPLVLYDGSGIVSQGIPVYSQAEMDAYPARKWMENVKVLRILDSTAD